MSTASTHIVAICGSLRKGSTNKGILRTIEKILPAGVTMDIIIPGDLPLYNQDTEKEPNAAVAKYFDRVKKGDAFIFAAPEYNYSVSAALKNSIDWASRSPDGNLFNDKPVGIVSAGGGAGGLRSQNHLRDIGVCLNMHFVNGVPIQFKLWADKTSDFISGDLTSKAAHDELAVFVPAFLAWSRRINSSRIVK